MNKWFFERSARDFPPAPCDGRDRGKEEVEISFSSLAFKGNRRAFRHSKRKKEREMMRSGISSTLSIGGREKIRAIFLSTLDAIDGLFVRGQRNRRSSWFVGLFRT